MARKPAKQAARRLASKSAAQPAAAAAAAAVPPKIPVPPHPNSPTPITDMILSIKAVTDELDRAYYTNEAPAMAEAYDFFFRYVPTFAGASRDIHYALAALPMNGARAKFESFFLSVLVKLKWNVESLQGFHQRVYYGVDDYVVQDHEAVLERVRRSLDNVVEFAELLNITGYDRDVFQLKRKYKGRLFREGPNESISG